MNNQRHLGLAFMMYAQDHDEFLPPYGDRWPEARWYWPDYVRPYAPTTPVTRCPSWPRDGKYPNQQGLLVSGVYGIGVSYGHLFRYSLLYGTPLEPTHLSQTEHPAQTLLATDAQGSLHVYDPSVWPMTVDWNHDGLLDTNPGVLTLEGPYNRGDPYRHNGGAICSFADGHARWIPANAWLRHHGDFGVPVVPASIP